MTAINLVVAYAIVFGGAMGWVLPSAGNPASNSASDIDGLFQFMAAFGSAIFVYVFGYVLYFSTVFRRQPGESRHTIGTQIHHAPRLEFWWTVIPTLLLIVLVYLSIEVWYKVQFGSGGTALTTEVVAHQFDFEVRYPGLKTSIYTSQTPMHLPAGKPVRILISSADVLHSFWVPEFRVKAGAVPGLVQNLNLTPTHTGKYDIICAEYCGINHSRMQGKLIVDTPSDFDAWLAQMKGEKVAAAAGSVDLAKGNALAGKALFQSKCSACHAIGPFSQKIVGPGLAHILDDPAHPNLVNGNPATPANIADLITKGYTGDIGAMPNRQMLGLSDQDLADVVAYLASQK